MAPFKYSDSNKETLNSRRAPNRRRNQERTQRFGTTKALSRMSLSQETVSNPDIPFPPPSSTDFGDNRLRTGFFPVREVVKAKTSASSLPAASESTQKYIEELEKYRDGARNKYQALQDVHHQRVQKNKETVKKLEEERNLLTKQAKEQTEKLKAMGEQHKQDLAIKDGQIAWAMSKKEEYLNHLLNVLPPLVEAEKEKERKLKQLESVDVKNEKLVSEINQHKEEIKRLKDENKNLKILKVRLNKLSSGSA
jgi:chromosome segregation ATPase